MTLFKHHSRALSFFIYSVTLLLLFYQQTFADPTHPKIEKTSDKRGIRIINQQQPNIQLFAKDFDSDSFKTVIISTRDMKAKGGGYDLFIETNNKFFRYDLDEKIPVKLIRFICGDEKKHTAIDQPSRDSNPSYGNASYGNASYGKRTRIVQMFIPSKISKKRKEYTPELIRCNTWLQEVRFGKS